MQAADGTVATGVRDHLSTGPTTHVGPRRISRGSSPAQSSSVSSTSPSCSAKSMKSLVLSVIRGRPWRRQAASDPGVVLWSGSATTLAGSRQTPPGSGDLGVIGDDGTVSDPRVETSSCGRSPAADLGPLVQLGDGDEGEPDACAGDPATDPGRCAALLEQGRDVGVDDNIGHLSRDPSGERTGARRAQIGKERFELVVRVPDVNEKLVGVPDLTSLLKSREIADSPRRPRCSQNLFVLLAHCDKPTSRGRAWRRIHARLVWGVKGSGVRVSPARPGQSRSRGTGSLGLVTPWSQAQPVTTQPVTTR